MTLEKKRGRSATEDSKAILNCIRQLVRALRAFDKEAQSRYGVGAAQMFILHVLQHEAELSMNEVADRTATDQSSVSLAVGRLVEQAYVRRMTSDEDRRTVRLSLTARGRTLVRRSPPAAQERILSSVAGMPARERADLLLLLGKLLTGLGPAEGRVPMLFQDDESNSKAAARKRKRS